MNKKSSQQQDKSYCCELFNCSVFVQGETCGQFRHAGGNVGLLVFKIKDTVGNAVRNDFHLVRAHAARRHGRGADANTAGHKGAALFTGNGVLVGRNVYLVKVVLQFLAGTFLVGQVDQQQMVIGAARNQLDAARGQFSLQSFAVFNDFTRIITEFRLQCLAKADGLAGNDVFQRAALCAREDGRIDALDDVLVVGQNQAAARAAQRFVGRRGDNIGIRNRALVLPACDKTCNVRHIDHQHSAVAMSNFGQLFKIDSTGIGGGTGHKHLGAHLGNLLGKAGVVNAAIFGRDAIGNEIIVFAAHIDRGTVGQVPALGKIHAHDGIAQIQQRKIDGQVGLCAGVGLHVCILGTKQLAGTVNGNLLDLIHKLAAAVIAVTGITLGIFVGQYAAHSGHNGGGNNIFAGDQLNVLALAGQFAAHGGAQFGIGLLHKADRIDQILIHFRNLPLSMRLCLQNIRSTHSTALQC